MKNALVLFVASLLAIAQSAFAAAPATLADLTTGIDFSSVGLAVLAVAALIIVVDVGMRGAKIVIRAVRGL